VVAVIEELQAQDGKDAVELEDIKPFPILAVIEA
jgi:hypothetical protein